MTVIDACPLVHAGWGQGAPTVEPERSPQLTEIQRAVTYAWYRLGRASGYAPNELPANLHRTTTRGGNGSRLCDSTTNP